MPNIFSQLTLSLMLPIAFSCQAGQADGQKPINGKHSSGVALSVSQNPFGENAELQARLRLIDKSSPSLSWFTQHAVAKKDGQYASYLIGESLIRTMGLKPEENSALELAFKLRLEKHHQNVLPLVGQRDRERDSRFSKAGYPPQLLKNLSVPEMDKEELNTLLTEYEQKEFAAEVVLLEELEEILAPRKFQQLVDYWLNQSNLYSPVARHYLQLSDEQMANIKDATYEKLRYEFELLESVKTSDIEERNKFLTSDQKWHENIFKPFAFLSLDQFRKARRTLKGWNNNPSFEQRMSDLKIKGSISSKAELRVLGKLYRDGIDAESRTSLR